MDDVKKTEGFRARLQETIRKSLNAASADDVRFGGIAEQIDALKEERENLEKLTARVSFLRKRLKKELVPRDKISLSPFFFFLLLFILSTILGGILFERECDELFYNYLSYVTPIYAALLTGAVLYINKNSRRFRWRERKLFVKYDVLLYKVSAGLLCLGLVFFIVANGKTFDFLWGMFFPPGLVSSIFYFGLRHEKWINRDRDKPSRINLMFFIFSIVLLIASCAGSIWWMKIVSETGTDEISKSLTKAWRWIKCFF